MKNLDYWQKRVFFSVWITYLAFYLVRINLSVAIPGMMEEYGISKTEIGAVLTALFAMYAVGQFVNGQIGNHFNSRNFITVSLIFSALINFVFGFMSNGILITMIVLWGINGFVQSMGWGPTVNTVANWFEPKKRLKYSSILGTSYIAGSALSLFLAGIFVKFFGWRGAFIIPPIIAMMVAAQWYIFGRGKPEDVGQKIAKELPSRVGEKKSFMDVLKFTVSHKGIWIAGFALFGLNIVRYGFLDWAPTFLFESEGVTITKATFKVLIFPIAGIAGALSSNYISKKFFDSKPAMAAVSMLVGLFFMILLYPKAVAFHWLAGIGALTVIGFLSFGPHVLIVSTMPMYLGSRKAACASAGFIDGMGYIGASLTGILSGYLADTFGWSHSFYFWAFGAVLGAMMMFLISRMLRNSDTLSIKTSDKMAVLG